MTLFITLSLRILERVQTGRGPADGGTRGTKAVRGQRGRDLVAAVLEGGAGRRSGWDQPRAVRRRLRWLLTRTQLEAPSRRWWRSGQWWLLTRTQPEPLAEVTQSPLGKKRAVVVDGRRRRGRARIARSSSVSGGGGTAGRKRRQSLSRQAQSDERQAGNGEVDGARRGDGSVGGRGTESGERDWRPRYVERDWRRISKERVGERGWGREAAVSQATGQRRRPDQMSHQTVVDSREISAFQGSVLDGSVLATKRLDSSFEEPNARGRASRRGPPPLLPFLLPLRSPNLAHPCGPASLSWPLYLAARAHDWAAQVFAGDEHPRFAPLSGTMGTSAQESPLWKQIDDAEYYLVSGSFEQAMLTALSVADQIRTASLESGCDQDELLEMLESTGMVLVQALKELRRTPEMFVQLKTMFGSVPSVPARVFLTGATIQMAAGSVSDLRPIFEEYLANWRYTNDEVYVLDGGHDSTSNGFVVTPVMSTGQYFQVAELYTLTFLCIVSQDNETAISWAQKADLTERSRQDLLKKLHAVRLAANKKLSTVEGVNQTAERNLSTSTNGSTPLPHEDPPKIAPVCDGLKKALVKSAQPSEHVANQFDPLFWWFHSIRLKFGKIHIVLPSGKLMFLFSLLFSTMYMLQRKTAGLKRTVFQQAASLRRAFLDALRLAFSVQMNPLAAVQQVPQAPRGSWL